MHVPIQNAVVLTALCPQTMQQLLVSPTELSELLGLAPQTIYNRLCTGGDLPPAIRIGRLPRFAIADVHAWLDTKRAAAMHKHQPAPPCRPGRPTKAEQVARRQSIYETTPKPARMRPLACQGRS